MQGELEHAVSDEDREAMELMAYRRSELRSRLDDAEKRIAGRGFEEENEKPPRPVVLPGDPVN